MSRANPMSARAAAAHVDAARFSVLPRPQGRDLSQLELREFVAELAAWPELWIECVTHDPGQRRYAELLSDEHLTAWLICWMDDHDTGFHDHDRSAGAVAVVGGSVREERLTLGAPPWDHVFDTGEVFDFSPSDIHRVRHAGSEPAVTLHVYSPPLLRMGSYFVDAYGVLARLPTDAAEELRPLEASTDPDGPPGELKEAA